MNVTILGSGSKGNALVVECAGERILVDAGFSARELSRRLEAAGIAPRSISSLIITHEHSDHSCGARVAARRFGWTVYATPGTIARTARLREVLPIPISTRESLALDTMHVRTVRTPHDAMEPVALIVESISSGARCGIAYDIGHVSQSVERALGEVDILILESNHDDVMLREGPYPLALKRRITGGHGHLSNAHAAGLLERLVHRGLRHVVLAHLSEDNNRPGLALEASGRAARRARYRGTLSIAAQHGVTRVHAARGSSHEQMLLDL